jgi:uncharacterized protein YndB with AHSA1/START domain
MIVLTETIRQEVEFRAGPERVYRAWMDSGEHSRITAAQAVIEDRVGGSFTTFDGWAQGRNIELVPGKKIVESWRAEQVGWPKRHYSRITITLKKKGKGTLLEFVQTRVPHECADEIAQGWREFYWKPMKRLLK